jgi:hypothetical protein
MRSHALALIAPLCLFGLSSHAGAQVGRLPRLGRVPPAEGVTRPAPLPPEVPAVSRALEYRRSRWSAEAYSLVSTLVLPSGSSGTTGSTTFGGGARGDFRFGEHLAATADATASYAGDPMIIATVEVGTRYRGLAPDARIRPFVDVRAGYMHVYDTFAFPYSSGGNVGSGSDFGQAHRYSRGVGGIAGSGLEFSLTNTLGLTTEVLAMRNRMTTYRATGPATIPSGTEYWMTSYRYTIGLRYNPRRVLQLGQNPRS